MSENNIIVVKEGDNKLEILDRAVEEAGFYDCLENSFEKSGKKREEFIIAVKPNFMVLTSATDHSNYTDTEMVVHMLKKFIILVLENYLL
ncbi:MAG: hypothetical protein GY797_19415 [Deltaproteobacteria bacterium]|nr:hypothetical protein [Deltaproteobacteria bacterium]